MRGGEVRYLVGLITRRPQVQILLPQPILKNLRSEFFNIHEINFQNICLIFSVDWTLMVIMVLKILCFEVNDERILLPWL